MLQFEFREFIHLGEKWAFEEQLDHFANQSLQGIPASQEFWFRADPDIKDMAVLAECLN